MNVRASSPFVRMLPAERLALLIGLFLLAFSISIGNFYYGASDLALIVSFITYIVIIAFSIAYQRNDPGWFQPLVFYMIWSELVRTTLPQISLFIYGLEFHNAISLGKSDLNAIVVKSLLLHSLGILFLYIGYLSCNFKLNYRAIEWSQRVNKKRIRLVVFLSAIVATIALVYLVQKAGSLEALTMQRGLARTDRISAEVGGAWSFTVLLLKTVCLVWLIIEPSVYKKRYFIAIFIYSLVISFLATGSRGGTLFPIVMAFAIWMVNYKRIRYRYIFGVALLALFVLGVLGEFRTASFSASSWDAIQVDTGFITGVDRGIDVMTSRITQSSGLFAVIAKVPNEVDYLFGRSYLSVLVAPIPSFIWGDKPLAGGRLVADLLFGNPLNSIPPTAVGEAYWNFGLFGVALVMFFFGVFLKQIYFIIKSNQNASWVWVLFFFTMFRLSPSSDGLYGWLHSVVPAFFFLAAMIGFPKIISFSNRE